MYKPLHSDRAYSLAARTCIEQFSKEKAAAFSCFGEAVWFYALRGSCDEPMTGSPTAAEVSTSSYLER